MRETKKDGVKEEQRENTRARARVVACFDVRAYKRQSERVVRLRLTRIGCMQNKVEST